MKWTDVHDIAIALDEAYPEVDPLRVRFTDLHNWILALDELDDDPAHSGEKVPEGDSDGMDRGEGLRTGSEGTNKYSACHWAQEAGQVSKSGADRAKATAYFTVG
jgi:FeS assembly protein IscX